LAYFSETKAGESVLEYGGGFGQNLVAVARRARVCLVEPSRVGREAAEAHGIEVFRDLAEVGERRFDVVLCRHVLEHLDHPLRDLEQLRARLEPSGRVIVVVPVEDPRQGPDRCDLNHHLYCWNPQTLCNLLSRAGLRDVRWRFEYYGARRRLLPIYTRFGGPAYARAVRAVGRLFRFRELVGEARRD
jgi:SAM-dependent methyltransferase